MYDFHAIEDCLYSAKECVCENIEQPIEEEYKFLGYASDMRYKINTHWNSVTAYFYAVCKCADCYKSTKEREENVRNNKIKH